MAIAAASASSMKLLSDMYSGASPVQDEKILEAMTATFDHCGSTGKNIDVMLIHALMMIHRFFAFKKVAIAMKSEDGRFRYRNVMGFIGQEEAMKDVAYTVNDVRRLQSEATHRFGSIIYLTVPAMKRQAAGSTFPASDAEKDRLNGDEMVEGDLIHVFINGKNREINGWIELSSPRDGKFPSSRTLHWLSLIANMMASLT
jgi:hypothetical protein